MSKLYPDLDLSKIDNSAKLVNLSPADILGTSAISLLNFKQMLKDKNVSIEAEKSRRQNNLSSSTAKQTTSKKRAITEERSDLPICFISPAKPVQPTARYHSRREEHPDSKLQKPKEDDTLTDEREIMMLNTLKEHKRLMRKVNQERLQNRINNSAIVSFNQHLKKSNVPRDDVLDKGAVEIKPARLFSTKEIEDSYQTFLK